MPENRVEIRTRDGLCPAYVFRPDGEGPWPSVIVYMDAPGIRDGLFRIAELLRSHGYYVLLPDLLYRMGGSQPGHEKRYFTEPEYRSAWLAKALPAASLSNVRSDTEALLAFLSEQPDVRQPWVGVTGYCMGGGHALTAAGMHPDRIAVAASYHGGGLSTDAPDSPHLLAPRMRAKLYIAGADEDPLFPTAMKERLEAALREAGVRFTLETWKGQKHGFAPPDTPVHTKEAGLRHEETVLALLSELKA